MQKQTVFWDEDTQRDFMLPDGRLAVPGAEKILVNLGRLTGFAREKEIPIIGSVDAHLETDSEISTDPDYRVTFPPHCMVGTEGQRKVPETAPRNPLWIDSAREDPIVLRERVQGHRGEIILKKQTLNVFSNLNSILVLDALKPMRVVVYGVATDFCVAHAVEGLLKRNLYEIFLVKDAVMPINPSRGVELETAWFRRGVIPLSTDQVLSRSW